MKKRALVVLAFVAFGVVAGLSSVWAWRYTDMVSLLNIPGSLLGNAVYVFAIELIGDPHSSQAHFTIPWLLRVPQVYVTVSFLLWGLVGMVLAWLLKPRPLAWTAGVYLALSAGTWLAAAFGLI